MNRAVYYTASELAQRGMEHLPDELVSNRHLIYSSPATLAFNSPGAEGFGVKRAGLALPGSVMLLVAPGCCGRNTSLVSSLPAYQDRFFYLNMDETDVVTGRHLKKVPQAVEEVVNCLKQKPSVVMICITCVDALLGTDMSASAARRRNALASRFVRVICTCSHARAENRPWCMYVKVCIRCWSRERKKGTW